MQPALASSLPPTLTPSCLWSQTTGHTESHAMSTRDKTAHTTVSQDTGSRVIAVKLLPQQLIMESAKATAEVLTNVLTSQSASITLPMYDWDSKDAY